MPPGAPPATSQAMSSAFPPNEALQPTGATIPAFPRVQRYQAAPVAELWHSMKLP
jgi:hypothetical protein